jgi:DNA-binding transcriptional LysR family regulator
VALGRSSFLETQVAEGRLVTPFDSWIETEEAFYVTRAAGQEMRPPSRLFWSWITSCAEA